MNLDSIFVSITTAAAGFVAGMVLEKVRRRGAMNDTRRKAYAGWFTQLSLVQQRIDVVCQGLVGFPKEHEKRDELIKRIDCLAPDVRALVGAMNEAYLAEYRHEVRQLMLKIHDGLLAICDSLEFAAGHYRENLELHGHFGSLTPDDLAKMPDDARAVWQAATQKFDEHDSTCPFKSRQFHDNLRDHANLLNGRALTLREIIAVTTSR